MSCTFVCLVLFPLPRDGPQGAGQRLCHPTWPRGAPALMGTPSGQRGGEFSDGNAGNNAIICLAICFEGGPSARAGGRAALGREGAAFRALHREGQLS